MEYLIAAIRRLTGFELGDEPAQFVSSFGARRMVVNRYHAGRVALAGDAAAPLLVEHAEVFLFRMKVHLIAADTPLCRVHDLAAVLHAAVAAGG